VFMLENLKTRVFECQECAQARRELELRIEQERLRKIEAEKLRALEAAEKRRLEAQELEKQRALLNRTHSEKLADKALQEKMLQEKYDEWVASQVDNVRKRRERDEESHQRWIRSRAVLQ